MALIFFEPGHGGKDPGAIGKLDGASMNEKDVVLEVVGYASEMLVLAGHTVEQSRVVDEFIDLDTIASRANASRADYFVAVHCNAFHDPNANGIETYRYPGSSSGLALAGPIHRSLIACFPDVRDRGIKEASYVTLRMTNMAAAYIELPFITNPADFKVLRDQRKKLGTAIAEGIMNAITG